MITGCPSQSESRTYAQGSHGHGSWCCDGSPLTFHSPHVGSLAVVVCVARTGAARSRTPPIFWLWGARSSTNSTLHISLFSSSHKEAVFMLRAFDPRGRLGCSPRAGRGWSKKSGVHPRKLYPDFILQKTTRHASLLQESCSALSDQSGRSL